MGRNERKWSNTTRSGKLHYNEDQLAAAKAASAMEYALQHGYELVGTGFRRTMKDHDSMIFLGDGRWYWNSQGRSGRAIEFVMYYENHTLPEAVLLLNGVDLATAKKTTSPTYTPKDTKKPQIEFELPTRSSDMRRAFGYLAQKRGLDYEIIREMVEQGRIFQAQNESKGRIFHNVAFAGLDKNGVIRAVSLRGCTDGSTFKAEVPGSDKHYPFCVPGQPDATTLCVFESAIDALSHATIEKLTGVNWREKNRVAMSGNNTISPILSQIDKYPNTSEIVFCLDNDAGGQKQYETYRKALLERGIPADRIRTQTVPVGKDWNEYLQTWRAVIKDYRNIKTTDFDGTDKTTTGETIGRIHYLADDKTISATSSFADKKHFHDISAHFLALQIPVIIETRPQLEELHRQEMRCMVVKKNR